MWPGFQSSVVEWLRIMKNVKIIRDIAWLVAAILVASFLTIAFDLYERFIFYTRALEAWNLTRRPSFSFSWRSHAPGLPTGVIANWCRRLASAGRLRRS